MRTISRGYRPDPDYERVGQFLLRTYSTGSGLKTPVGRISRSDKPSCRGLGTSSGGRHINWLQPRWEYMHYHPLIEEVDLNSIGFWEVDGEIVAVVHPEHSMGTAYFEIDPGYGALKGEMLTHAEEHISSAGADGRSLAIHINDRDDESQTVATEMGYARTDGAEEMSHFVIPEPFPAIRMPSGFRLKSLADDNDLAKLNRLLFRGFNHGDEPPDDSVEARKFMQSAPNYRMDLNIVVEAPGGDFVSYCGMWYEPMHRVAYVEPVCTDPDYRRMGLASAAILEGIRRCGEQGATVAYVGATLPVYLSIGFRQIFNCSRWRREWA